MTDRINALPPGTELGGYRIESLLGAGGFGITYRATEILLERPVALKEFLPANLATREPKRGTVQPIGSAESQQFAWGLDRFRSEARTLVAFEHPNIVRVHRYFEANGTGYLVMAFHDGDSLEDVLQRVESLEEDALLAILRPLAEGLAAVHAKGFLHRDIKPANVIIRRDGQPVLIDFGAARQALTRQSRGLTAIVTEGYAPYEQYEVDGDQGPWTDIYALGAVLYHCAMGRRPPEAPARVAARIRGQSDPLVPAAEIGAGRFSPTLLGAIDSALAVLETDRPQSVQALMDIVDGEVAPPASALAAPAAQPTFAAAATPTPAAPGRSDTLVVGLPEPPRAMRLSAPASPIRSGPAAIPLVHAPRRRRVPLLVGIGVVLVAGAALGALWGGGAFTPMPEPRKADSKAPPPPPPPKAETPADAAKTLAERSRRGPPILSWQARLPKSGADSVRRLVALPDGKLMLFGDRFDAAAKTSALWIWTLDSATGAKTSEKTLNDVRVDGPGGVRRLADGGYLIAGYRQGENGLPAAWVGRLSAAGDVAWERAYGDVGGRFAFAAAPMADGGMVVVGATAPRPRFALDGWAMRLDASGRALWERRIGGADEDLLRAVDVLPDGTILAAGWTGSSGAGELDIWIVKLAGDGATIWEKTLGGKTDDRAKTLHALPDGGALVLTETQGDNDRLDAMAYRLAPDGSVAWRRDFGGDKNAALDDALLLADGGFLLVGHTEGRVPGARRGWLVRLDQAGEPAWDAPLGDGKEDELRAAAALPDGGLAVAGTAYKGDPDTAPPGTVQADPAPPQIWVLRLAFP